MHWHRGLCLRLLYCIVWNEHFIFNHNHLFSLLHCFKYFLSSCHNLQLYDFKYSYLIQIIYTQFYSFSSLFIFNHNHLFAQSYINLSNLRINFFYLLWTFCPYLGSFCVVSSSLHFVQISPLAFFRWLTATSDRNAESCNRIPSNYCLP